MNPPANSSTVHNVLLKDIEIKGSVKFQQETLIDGKIEGEIQSRGSVTVGEHGDIRGEIKAQSVAVFGSVQGNITVRDRCDLKAHAVLAGDLRAPRLTMEEGATFAGRCDVNPKQVHFASDAEQARASKAGAA
jgi:cytoskeletal protein CcmA (bactofilin family)